MTDFRALCAELHVAFTTYAVDECHHNLLERARAALAEPEPEGPTDEDLWNTADLIFQANCWPTDAIRYARAVLARWGNHQEILDSSTPQPIPVSERLPGPEGPTDEELSDLWSRAAGQDQGPWPTQQHCFARAVLARWSRHTPVPVPVSERWPGPEDCTAEGRYWIWTKAGAIWRWQLVYLQFIDLRHGEQTHWLPAHALPLPTAND